jgi:hypothetical protein
MAGRRDEVKGERTTAGYPRGIAALVPALVRPAFQRRAPGIAVLVTDWEVIIGPAIAAVTVPRKLFSGTLAIACSGPIALELQHLSDQLIARINGHVGRVAVTRLRFVQDMTPARPVPRRKVRPAAAAEAARTVETLPPGPLRDALEALGRMVLTRQTR